MKWVSYGWSVLVGLLRVLIAFGLLSEFSGQFERVVVSMMHCLFTQA
jgi:hypothetical protein